MQRQRQGSRQDHGYIWAGSWAVGRGRGRPIGTGMGWDIRKGVGTHMSKGIWQGYGQGHGNGQGWVMVRARVTTRVGVMVSYPNAAGCQNLSRPLACTWSSLLWSL